MAGLFNFITKTISKRKKEILKMLEIDHKIGADPYENVARLKEIERIEKTLKRILKQKHERSKKCLIMKDL